MKKNNSKAIFSLGVMTGTSCDGADAAVLSFNGASERLEACASKSFPTNLRTRLKKAQGGTQSIREVALLTREYSAWLADFCLKQIEKNKLPRAKTIVSLHGQTLWHEPQNGVSIQALDASLVAYRTGCTVISGFRQPDLARGGEGAPLVPLYHWLRANGAGFEKSLPFAVHNIGGIANLTYLTRSTRELIAFDTGPGNALIDMAVEKMTRGRQSFDRDGKIARTAIGRVDWRKVQSLSRHAYFLKKPPKSTGKELFNAAFLARFGQSGAPLIATATAFTAHTMALAYSDHIVGKGHKLNKVFLAGGGANNPVLSMLFAAELASLCGKHIPVEKVPNSFGSAQYLEAMAFARLGIEALFMNRIALSNVTGAREDAFGPSFSPSRDFHSLLKLAGKI